MPTTVPATIDRRALVARHTVTLKTLDTSHALHVGNGDFAFGFDVTGLQTFASQHADTFPIQTIASWARADVVAPATRQAATTQAATTTSTAPARQTRRPSLANLAFVDGDGQLLTPSSISNVEQTLDLWTGLATSTFDYAGERIEVLTVADPANSRLAVRINAASLARRRLGIRLSFDPRARDGDDADRTADWLGPSWGSRFTRRIDGLAYFVDLLTNGDRPTTTTPVADSNGNAFELTTEGDWTELTLGFEPIDPTLSPQAIEEAAGQAKPLPTFGEIREAAAASWEAFWADGAAIDFSGCTDARAPELERRVVLSQYLSAVHCAGTIPSPASGLAFDRPDGDAELDTVWWRVAPFAMWGRPGSLERTLDFYQRALPKAKAAAVARGMVGARWPRVCDPDGAETPDAVGPFMVWQQPHVIYFAEAAYRANRTRETLDRYATLVDETARYLTSYAREENGRFVLGPGLVPAQESFAYDRGSVINPTFELAYWAWALGVAQKWRDRLGLPREEAWDRVQQKLAKPIVREGRYAAVENEPYLINGDHPSFLWALGLVPKTHLIDDDVMRETARWTRAKWKWNDAWGVDFAGLAQTAARLGDAELAVDALLIESERNRYTVTGHNHPSDDRPIDLSANGALLAAVALMAGGWDGITPADAVAPGFPKNGKWDVRVEGFVKVI